LDAASGFIHGFRCNIQALALLIAERYHRQPLQPVFQSKIAPNDVPSFKLLTKYLIEMVSKSAPLFELFHYFCSTVTLHLDPDSSPEGEPTYIARVWPPFPIEYARQRWSQDPTASGRLEIIMQYGFDLYGKDIPTHYYTHPSDHFRTEKSAYIHPVFHAYCHHQCPKQNTDIKENGHCTPGDKITIDTCNKCGEPILNNKEVAAYHLQESIRARWDEDDYGDSYTNCDQYTNSVFNALAAALNIPTRLDTNPVLEKYINLCYPPMTSEDIEQILKQEPGVRYIMPEQNIPNVSRVKS